MEGEAQSYREMDILRERKSFGRCSKRLWRFDLSDLDSNERYLTVCRETATI
jgi:hypothetical protein